MLRFITDLEGPFLRVWKFLLAALLLPAAALLPSNRHAAGSTSPAAAHLQGFGLPGNAFERNEGQAPGGARFLLRTQRGLVLFGASSIQTIPFARTVGPSRKAAARLRFNLDASIKGMAPLAVERGSGVVNYLLGRNPRHWHTDIPTYGKLLYRDRAGRPALEVTPLSTGFGYRRLTAARLLNATAGSLRAPTLASSAGSHRFVFPAVSSASNSPLLRTNRASGSAAAKPASSHPSLRFTKLIAGTGLNPQTAAPGLSADNDSNGIAAGPNGAVYVTGYTDSSNFPTTHPFERAALLEDAFVTKLGPTGKLIYSTYLGGAGNDFGLAIAVDSKGEAVAGGQTNSADFPLKDPPQPHQGGNCDEYTLVHGTLCMDAFVTKLSSAGNSLIFSTYLGGSNNDAANAVAVDAAGAAYVTGATESSNFPTVKPLETPKSGKMCIYETDTVDAGEAVPCDHGFVSKIAPDGGKFAYSTYVGGRGDDAGTGIAIYRKEAYVAGITDSENFPTVNPSQKSLAGQADAFLSVIDPPGTHLLYSTFLGGSGSDDATALTIDGKGIAYVAGETSSTDFPVTSHAYRVSKADPNGTDDDAFVTKLAPGDKALTYSTYLGGTEEDAALGIAVDRAGEAYVAGGTQSDDFPTRRRVEPYNQPSILYIGVQTDGFLSKLGPNGKSVSYSTFVGDPNAGQNVAAGVAVTGQGNAWVSGTTSTTQVNAASSGFVDDVFQPIPRLTSPTTKPTATKPKCKAGKKLLAGKCVKKSR